MAKTGEEAFYCHYGCYRFRLIMCTFCSGMANVSDLIFAHEQLDVKRYYHVVPV